jgi:hypothetical protein
MAVLQNARPIGSNVRAAQKNLDNQQIAALKKNIQEANRQKKIESLKRKLKAAEGTRRLRA